MTTHVEPGSGAIRHRTRKLFEGTANEKDVRVGQIIVKADARFVSTEITPFGPNDAQNERAKANGDKPVRPFYEVAAAAAKRVADLVRKKMDERKMKDGSEGAPAPVQVTVAAPTGPEAELAAQLAAFADDPEMQDVVIKKWTAKRNAQRIAAAPSALAPIDLPPHAEPMKVRKAV